MNGVKHGYERNLDQNTEGLGWRLSSFPGPRDSGTLAKLPDFAFFLGPPFQLRVLSVLACDEEAFKVGLHRTLGCC